MASSFLLACGDDGLAADAGRIDATPREGNASLEWGISFGGEELSCQQVGALSLSLRLIPIDGLSGAAEGFACTPLSGETGPVLPGRYNASIDLLSQDGRSLLGGPRTVPDVRVTAGAQTVIPKQTFEVAPTGSVSFAISSGAMGGNCAAVEEDGGGITGFYLRLRDQLGTCLSREFTVGGASHGSSCDTPVIVPCVESDATILFSGLPAGSYTIEAVAQKAIDQDCYRRTFGFQSVGAELLTELSVRRLNLDYNEVCDPDFEPPDAGMESP